MEPEKDWGECDLATGVAKGRGGAVFGEREMVSLIRTCHLCVRGVCVIGVFGPRGWG